MVIQKVGLVCDTANSNKYYDVFLYLNDEGVMTFESQYGAIGSSPKAGVCSNGSFCPKTVFKNGTLENHVKRLVGEANNLIQSKMRKGYKATGTVTEFDAAWVLSDLSIRLKLAGNAPTSVSDDEIVVEVVGIAAGVYRVAKVLADFNYEVLGEAVNPFLLTVRIGDMAKVMKKGDGWVLV